MTSRTSVQTRRSEHHQLGRITTVQSDVPAISDINGHFEMLVEHSFDSDIKRMSTVWQFIPEDPHDDPANYDLIVCECPARYVGVDLTP